MENENKILINHLNKIKNKNIIFSGNIKENFFLSCSLKYIKIHTNQFYNTNLFKIFSKNDICFRLLPKKNFFLNCNILVYFWIKNKIEVKFQLTYLLSMLKKKSKIFIIGKNKSGINSVQNILNNYTNLHKIDYKKKCSLYYGKIIKNSNFMLKKYFKIYIWKKYIIYTLPGLFDYKGIDSGSKLLISTFNKNILGEVLDIGSGSGILSIALHKISSKTKITLIDHNNTSLLCSKINLRKNHVKAKVLLSNIYSNIKSKFDLIISNPPTHCDIKNNFNIMKKIIYDAPKYLNKKGELRIVVHSYISCKKEFQAVFNTYKIIKKKYHFNVYQGILK